MFITHSMTSQMILTVWTQKFVGRAEIQIKMGNVSWRSAHDEQKHAFGPALVSIDTRWDICTFSVFNENHNLSRRVFHESSLTW